MTESLFFSMFAVLMGMVLTWFGLLSWFYSRIRSRHPKIYLQLECPSLFWNNSGRACWLRIKYIFKPIPPPEGDQVLDRMLMLMRVFFTVYIVLFTALIVAGFAFPMPNRAG